MRLLAALVALLALAVPAAAQAPAGPFVRSGATARVADHVHVIPDFGVGAVPNVGIIVGADAALIVDTGMGARNAETVLREAAPLIGARRLYLVTTHVHPEHDLGAHAFPAATMMIRSKEQEADIAEFGMQTAQAFASRSAVNAELLRGATFRKADVVFEGEHALDLGGGVKVRIMAMGPNHTRGDTAVLVQPDGVLFAGDIVMKAPPAFASPYSSLTRWQASLARFAALNPRIIVPSHGPMGDARMIGAYQTYLAEVRDLAAAQKRAGADEAGAVKAIGDALEPRYGNRGRIEGAARVGWREAR